MPTIKGSTINSMRQLNAMNRAQMEAIAKDVGIRFSLQMSAKEKDSPDFRGVGNQTLQVPRRRLALRFGFRKRAEQAQAVIAKRVRERQAKKKVGRELPELKVKELYVMARRAKRETGRKCVPSGLARMSKAQLIAYIKTTRKKTK